MSKQRRSFRLEDKLKILREADEIGIKKTLQRHNLSYSVLFRWREKLEVLNKLAIDQVNHPSQQELKLLIEENTRLKKIIAEQALLLEINKEYMRSHPHPKS
ncbi:transposase [Flavihumibacter petaseus]|uniref:Putative transposase n=1 Tax=Flavihumibacter petaseus NBRC 106054 TaxID=1220578 RepID=A0A0E9MVE5_9BACT|nr:transposase [Flavihumibacter petaseus]GAO41105.1 putative transposase [Flavihumibacter petaseus NBRC 106054]